MGCSDQDPTLKGVDEYKAEALAAVVSYDVRNAIELVDDDPVIFVDVREAEEIAKNGRIKCAVHVPRGFLEYYIDSKSSKHTDIFSSGKKAIFYCATGGRSLLAAKLAKDMGVPDPVYLEGGFKAWLEAGGAIVASTVPPAEATGSLAGYVREWRIRSIAMKIGVAQAKPRRTTPEGGPHLDNPRSLDCCCKDSE